MVEEVLAWKGFNIRYRTLPMLLIAIGVVLAACSSGSNSENVYEGDNPDVLIEPFAPSSKTDRESSCFDGIVRHPELCHTVLIGTNSYRYSYVPADYSTDNEHRSSGKAVIVDFGGPGLSVLSGNDLEILTNEYLDEFANHYDLIVVEEPWVTSDINDGCATALTQFYMSFRPDASEFRQRISNVRLLEAAEIVKACKLNSRVWGLDQESYVRILDAIEAKHDSNVVGFIGSSFGSVRWAYAGPERFDFTILIRPFPIGVGIDRLLQVRSDVILEHTEEVLQEMTPVDPPEGRSLSIDIADIVAARIVAAGNGTSISSAVEVGKLSDGMWQRYNHNSISPALLAYWQEVCSHIGSSNGGRWNGSVEDVLGYFKSFHRLCDGIPQRSLTVPFEVSNVCVVISKEDAVAPSKLARAVFESRGAAILISEESNHDSLDGFRECLDKIRYPNTQGDRWEILPLGTEDITTTQPTGTRPKVLVDAGRLGWEIIEEHGCEWQQERDGWDVELGPGSLKYSICSGGDRGPKEQLRGGAVSSRGGPALG